MRGPVRIAITLIWISFGMVGASTPASSALRIDTGAVIEADAETVVRIEEVFNRAEDAIAEKNLDALMALWATVGGTDQRVNLSLWAGDIHHLRYEGGAWRIVGQGRNGPNRPEFGTAPPPLF
jgi:hypothetical protein